MEQVRSLRLSPIRQSVQPLSLFFKGRKMKLVLKPAFALLVVVVILLSGAGGLVAVAQNDLPGEPLYAVKLAGEDIRLALTVGELAQMEQVENMIQNRIIEMATLAKNGKETPEELVNRLNYHLEHALRLAAGMNDEEMKQAMLMIRTRTEAQIRELNRINLTGNGEMLEIHMRLQEQLRLAELGLEDPLKFRQETRLRTQHSNPNNTATPTTEEESGSAGDQSGPQGTPSPQGPQGPQYTNTPQNTSAPNGPNGPQGPDGTPVPQGPQNTDAPGGPPEDHGPPTQAGGGNGHNGHGNPTPTPTTESEDSQEDSSDNGNPGHGGHGGHGRR
jgi:hypothetical protein